MKFQFYDWDDTIVTSKEALYLSYKKALEEWHLTFDFDYFNDLIYNDSGKYLAELCNFSPEEIAEVKRKKEEYYLNDFWPNLKFHWPKYDSDSSYYIISNTSEELIKKMIKKYDRENDTNHLEKYKILTSSSNKGSIPRKPQPDLYNAAFKMWISRMKPTDELHIYEDSAEGLLAASLFLHSYKKRITKFYLHHLQH